MIIVAFTSWKKRIDNAAKVALNIIDQTIKPDLIELNLSIEEFPNGEADLPKELNFLISKKLLTVNWIDKNTYTFKKFIPTLQKHFGEDYYLITIDDDKLYDKDYLEFLLSKIDSADAFCASHLGNTQVGGLMIYRSTIFDKDFWGKLTIDLIDTKVDDTYILHYLRSKKYRFLQNSDKKKRWQPFNETSPTRDYYLRDNRIAKAESICRTIFN